MTAILLFLTAILAATGAPSTEPPSLCVRVPEGIASGFVASEPAKQEGMKYTVIHDVAIHNRSRGTVSYNLGDFTLTAGERKYHPVARPGLGAIDIAQGGVLGPGEAIRGNLVFLVPQNAFAASLEFWPANWYQNGVPVIFCCAWSCR